MNRKTTLEFKVGLFISLGILALLIFVLATGKASIRGRGYELKVAFGYVGGLEEGAPVRVSGVRVGEVKRIEMEYDVTPRIILVMKMKPDVRIGRHSRVTIRTLGIIGEKYVEISPCQEKEFALPGETLTGIDPVDLDRFINMGEDLVRNLNEVVVGVQRVIGDRDVQNRVKSILDNTDGVVSGLRRITQDEEMVQRFKNILAGAETVLSRTDNFLEDATKLVASLETTSGEVKNFLSRNQPRVEGVLARVEELAATSNSAVKLFSEKVPKLEAVATSFQQTAEESTKLVRQLSTRGLVARLLKEETLVDEIKTEVQLLQ
ncbi:MAG TPA: MlaD family protein, partial [bacterium]|nr:MlaD family protein [bacterium]